jgi:hypothetical protein
MEFFGRSASMKHYAALLLCLPIIAMAEESSKPEPRRYEGVLSVGYVYGGEKLPDTQVATNGVATIRAGSGFLVSGGGTWKFSPKLALQGTIGYQFHGVNHSSGTAYVKRYPLEIVPFFYPSEKLRVGAGWRHNFNIEYDARYNQSGSIDFGSSDGLVVQLGYQLNPDVWLHLRYVKEEFSSAEYSYYEKQYTQPSVDASNIGFTLSHTF